MSWRRGHRDDQDKMIHIIDKNEGCVDYVILGIQQRKKQRNMERKLKRCSFSHVG